MNNVLVSFLGTGRYVKSGASGPDMVKQGRYETTVYSFNGRESRPVSMIIKALTESIPLSHVIVMGTAESMWDQFLFEMTDCETHPDCMELWEHLCAVKDEGSGFPLDDIRKTEECVNRHQRSVRYTLYPVESYRNEEDHTRIIQNLFRLLLEAGRIGTLYYDITHAFRHLPVLGIPVITILKNYFGKIDSVSVLYGLFEERSAVKEILKIDTLNGFLDVENAAIRMMEYNSADSFLEKLRAAEPGKNLDAVKYFSDALNLGDLNLMYRYFGQFTGLGMRGDSIEQKIFSEYQEKMKSYGNSSFCRFAAGFARYFYENYRAVQAVFIISQLFDAVKRDHVDLHRTYFDIPIEDIELVDVPESLRKKIGAFKVEFAFDQIRNRIAHPESTQADSMPRALRDLSVTQVMVLVETMIAYLEEVFRITDV